MFSRACPVGFKSKTHIGEPLPLFQQVGAAAPLALAVVFDGSNHAALAAAEPTAAVGRNHGRDYFLDLSCLSRPRARESGKMKWIWQASDFVRKFRLLMRFGELSRAPLQLLRFEIRQDAAECEWLARANDVWDADLPGRQRERNEAEQALRDAIGARNLLFASLPGVRTASFKVYRRGEPLRLIIVGEGCRDDAPPFRISSLVMQAKLYGFRFVLADGVFETLNESKFALVNQ